MFFGRVQVLRSIVRQDRVAVLLVGPRRVGKSSLLAQLDRILAARPGRVFRLHLQGVTSVEDLHILLRRKVGLDPESPGSLEDTLDAWLHEGPVTLLFDEVDGLVASPDGWALLALFRRLKANRPLGVVLTGYLDLYAQALDRRGPAYNFADAIELGPLDHAAALDLAVDPLARLGMRWASEDVPERLVELAGALPHLVQLLCDETLRQTTSDDGPVLTATQLERACRSTRVCEDLVWFVFRNTSELTRWICLRFCDEERFTARALVTAMDQELGRPDADDDVDTAIEPLLLFGYLRREGAELGWCAPLFRQQFADDPGRDQLLDQLVNLLAAPSPRDPR